MSEWRNQIIFFAIAVAESVIVFAIIGLLAQMLALGKPTLPWPTVLLLYLAGMFASWFAGGMRGRPATIALIFGAIGLATVYLAVSTASLPDSPGFDPLWIYRLFNRELTSEGVVAIVIALVAAVTIWRRTSRIMRDDQDAPDLLKRVFKIGLAVLAVAIIVDEIVEAPSGIAALLIPYFVATLAGMSIARLPSESPLAGRWTRIILVSLSAFIGLGMIAGYAGGRFGGTGLDAIFALWGWIIDGIIWVIRWPLTAVGWLIAIFIQWLQSFFNFESPEQPPQQTASEPPQFPEREAVESMDSGWVEAVLEALQWPLTFLLLILIVVVLALAYRRIIRRIVADDGTERESIRDEVEEISYFDLLKGLLPDWLTRRGSRRTLWKHPETPGIAEIFILYFQTMEIAMEYGMPFNPNQTPSERSHEMTDILPGAPVQEITTRFNAACYGDVPTEQHHIERLRDKLQSAVEIIESTATAEPSPANP